MSILDYIFGPPEYGPKNEVQVIISTAAEQSSKANIIYFPLYSTRFRKGKYLMELYLTDGKIFKSESQESYFTAMFELRKQLEYENIQLCCWGARKDVWPSGMQADMGSGLEAGSRNKNQDSIVKDIFSELPVEEVSITGEQKDYIFSEAYNA
ncbi:MAG: hypothetical protein BV456_11685 [Thermoplasmata archaeon M8B2D]|nr:MAG: hypothetical protein BV456_11685 [Thermoplasmata archaeon M8B2D]